MRALLLYNPEAGRLREWRAAVVTEVAEVLRGFGYELDVEATLRRGSAGAQARAAIDAGVRTVFACGGDGTVHDVLQGIVGTDARMGLIPLGSANALCRELGMPLDPIAAARAYARAEVREVAVGRACGATGSRYFLTMAGAGPDGALMHAVAGADRSRWGRWVYAAYALRLLLRGAFLSSVVRYRVAGGDAWLETGAVAAMALRIGSLGGVFPGVARGASLRNDHMRLVLVKGPALVGLPLWFASSGLRAERWNPLLVREDVDAFTVSGAGVHVQADGEWIGESPVQIILGKERVRILSPAGALR